jgi:oligosaccharide repeat unit polymerase
MVILSLALLFLAVVGRRLQGSWIAPGAFFALVWFGVVVGTWIGAPLYVRVTKTEIFDPAEYEVGTGAMAWVFVAALAVWVGSLIGGGFKRTIVKPALATSSRSVTLPNLRLAVVGSSALALFYVAILTWFSTVAPALRGILLPFVYLSPVLGGLLMATGFGRGLLFLSALSLVPDLWMGLYLGPGRAQTLVGIMLWVIGYLSGRVLVEQGKVRLHFRYVLFGAAAIPLVFALGIWAQQARFERAGVSVEPEFNLYKTRHIFFGFLPAFSHWSEEYWHDPSKPRLGAITFSGQFDFLGVFERPSFEDFEVDPGVFTNVYTFHREILEDFTLAGALIYVFLLGFLGGHSYRQVSRGSVRNLALLIIVYVFMAYSVVGSPFRFNSYLAAFLLAWAYLLLETSRGTPVRRGSLQKDRHANAL